MKKNVIVSLADANYFPLLEELVDSIKRYKEKCIHMLNIYVDLTSRIKINMQTEK